MADQQAIDQNQSNQNQYNQYDYDPHLDPQLYWSGKQSAKSLIVPSVSLHVQEIINPQTIINNIFDYKNQQLVNNLSDQSEPSKFLQSTPPKKSKTSTRLTYYQHDQNWINRLIAGDSLIVINSLLQKEGLGGKVQTIYIDPPYGIKYGSNFQPFVQTREVRDGRDEDLSQTVETIKAFRDTWELGIHSYLTYLRDRLFLARQLLDETGSCFVQISDENVHLVRIILDEIFGRENFCSEIAFSKSSGLKAKLLKRVNDYILWYAKDKNVVKYRPLYKPKIDLTSYTHVELADGTRRSLTPHEKIRPGLLPANSRPFRTDNLSSVGGVISSCDFGVKMGEKTYYPAHNHSWKTHKEGMENLGKAGRLISLGNTLRYLKYADDLPVTELDNFWTDTGGASDKTYVVQTSIKVIQRCLLMTTDPGDLILDITCGSGTSAYVAEQWGRRWITCDTSRVAITLTKQRLMTAIFEHYQLAQPNLGIQGGLVYKTVPHISLKSIAYNTALKEGMSRQEIEATIRQYADQEILFDQPVVDKYCQRITGPFSVESLPAPNINYNINNNSNINSNLPDQIVVNQVNSIALSLTRNSETIRLNEWCEELYKTGIRGKKGEKINFSDIEILPGTQYIHAQGQITQANDHQLLNNSSSHKPSKPSKSGKSSKSHKSLPINQVILSFSQPYQALDQLQVKLAIAETLELIKEPTILIFCAFEFDPVASTYIDNISNELLHNQLTVLKIQMNIDLLTNDLKKKRANNDSFWLVGQPDVKLIEIPEGKDAGKYQIEILGFDYFNPQTGAIESGGKQQIIMWLLDHNYDGRCLYPHQVFFPLNGLPKNWEKLAKNLQLADNLEYNSGLLKTHESLISLPFNIGASGQIAVKIIDDRGLESLQIITKKI